MFQKYEENWKLVLTSHLHNDVRSPELSPRARRMPVLTHIEMGHHLSLLHQRKQVLHLSKNNLTLEEILLTDENVEGILDNYSFFLTDTQIELYVTVLYLCVCMYTLFEILIL